MKVAGIIAEYNPFHSGHQYHIKRTKELTGCDFTVAVMSGDFVQRGAPALADKYVRAQMALSCGADLVLELPVLYACASAEFFAWGGVALLDALSLTDVLSFGAELDDARLFWQVSGLLAREGGAFSRRLQEGLREGLSFPAARAQALLAGLPRGEAGELSLGGSAELPPEGNAGLPLGGNAELPPEGSAGLALENSLPQIRALLSSPNNLLGLEYCKALREQNSSIQPVTLLRDGSDYHEGRLQKGRAPSASAVRAVFKEAAGGDPGKASPLLRESLAEYLPDAVCALLSHSAAENSFLTEEDFDLLLHYCLLSMPPEEMCCCLDVSPDLAARIKNTLNQYRGFSQFTSLLKTREVTYTRIQRSLLHLLLKIREAAFPVPYARVLGFKKAAAPLLKEINSRSRIPVFTKLSRGELLLDQYGKKVLEENTFASNLYEAVLCKKQDRPFIHEYQKPVIMI